MTGTTAAVIKAIRDDLTRRGAAIDSAHDVVEICIRVKLQPGTTWVRGVVYQEERTVRSRGSDERGSSERAAIPLTAEPRGL